MIHAVTSFASAFLLFLVQPLWARLTLPVAGGSGAVWAVSMLAFQALLLGGYAATHLIARRLPGRAGAVVHLALLLAGAAVLPVAWPQWLALDPARDPTAELLLATGAGVGLPFLALATLSPAVQRWFAHGAAGRDPYPLYAASNAGSLLGLCAAPMVEPWVGVAAQASAWRWGYCALLGGVAVCAWPVLRAPTTMQTTAAPNEPARRSTWTERLTWVSLAAIPSALSVAVTSHLQQAVATLPLLWTLPLALYLLTFIAAFARQPPPAFVVQAVAAVTLPAAVFVLAIRANHPASLLIGLHLLTVAALCLACHLRLAERRPEPARLTSYYLWLAFGGALGGAFNAVVAPLLFTGAPEYPLALVAAAVAAFTRREDLLPAARRSHGLFAGALGGGLAGLLALAGTLQAGTRTMAATVLAAAGTGVVWLRSRAGLAFGLSAGAVLAAAQVHEPAFEGTTVAAARSFHGLHKVTDDRTAGLRQLFHGTTVHGRQALDPGTACTPSLYYHRTGPAGQALTALTARDRRPVGAVGLGTGCLACYAAPGQPWTFFEIDPVVPALARSAFTFLQRSPGRVQTVIGDARVTLARQPDRHFGTLVLDAYSSDTVPAHLLTREAMVLYVQKLAPSGAILAHVSNRYFDLAPVIARLGHDHGLQARVREEPAVGESEARDGKVASRWLILAAPGTLPPPLAEDPRWLPVRFDAAAPPWTDDLASPLLALDAGD